MKLHSVIRIITLFSLIFVLSCVGGGGGGGGEGLLALVGLGGGGSAADVPAPKLEILYEGVTRESGSTLDIGSEPINTSDGKTGTVTIKNSGNVTITLPGSPNIVALSGTNENQFTISQPSSSGLAPGQSTSFTINFKPTSIGEKIASIKIESSDAAVSAFQMNLKGEGGAAAPKIAVSVAATQVSANGSHAMGSVEVDSTGGAVTFTVKNNGSADAILDNPSVISTDPQFVLNLAGFSGTIAANTSKTFNIQFAPASTGSKSSNITIAYNTSMSFVFTVTGTGTPKPVPTIAISHDSNNLTAGGTIPTFGVIWPTLSSATKTVTINNTGTATMTGITITKPSGDAAQFTVSAFSGGATLAAGASGTFTIRFDPVATGSKTAVVRVATSNGNNGAASQADINVSGTGKTGAEVLVSWTATSEKAANDTDGGYKVCYSQGSGFTAVHNGTSVYCADVPNAGGTTPNSKVISVPNFGNWYFKVYSYGKFNTAGGTPSSQSSVVSVPST
ncbi:choice-of-anchor D domain-containing protein [Leptospira sp. 96542]|nr:choice-of-anchor D domain-containing protein [Leptospira sp. 96542]